MTAKKIFNNLVLIWKGLRQILGNLGMLVVIFYRNQDLMCRNRNLGQIPQKNFLNSQFIIPEKEEVQSTHAPEKMQQSVHSLFPFHMGSCLLLNGK